MKELTKKFYGAKDITCILGCCKSIAYQKIAMLNDLLSKRYPNIVIFPHKIPIWFWNECTQPKGESKNEED